MTEISRQKNYKHLKQHSAMRTCNVFQIVPIYSPRFMIALSIHHCLSGAAISKMYGSIVVNSIDIIPRAVRSAYNHVFIHNDPSASMEALDQQCKKVSFGL